MGNSYTWFMMDQDEEDAYYRGWIHGFAWCLIGVVVVGIIIAVAIFTK
jgi:hypothetical protein